MTTTLAADGFEQEARRESLLILYRHTPTAAIAHIVAAGLVVYALSPVVALGTLVIWWAGLALAAILRLVAAKQFVARWPIDEDALPSWVRIQTAMAFIQTAFWGATVFIIWPDSIEYRVLLVAVLIGIISAGGMKANLSISMGVASCRPTPQDAFPDFIAKTDKALYQAKNRGRDRIEVSKQD